ncbi:MAG: glycosyltransferase [Candidatus Micrarchaeia archaeon]|jgi:hypothetical protein
MIMKKLSHIIITRMAFNPEDPQWGWRLPFYQSMALPRLLRQTDQNFEIWVRCHPAHNDIVAALHPKVHPFQGYGVEDEKMEFPADEQVRNYRLPRAHIQTRLDCDDLVSEDFVARIHQEVSRGPDKPLLVSFQPWKLDLYTLTRYRMGQRYGSENTSMFLSLYQPEIGGGKYWRIMDYRHGHIWRELGEPVEVVTIPEGYCDMVIHDKNKLTVILKGDRPLEISNA